MDNGHMEIIYPPGVSNAGGRVRRYAMPLLVPASWVYAGVSNAVRSARSADTPPSPAGTQVISVGNLEAGGCGKTPFSIHLLSGVEADGGTPVYISRGFGGRAERLGVVTVVMPHSGRGTCSAGRGGVRYLARSFGNLAVEVGDEGAMVARRLPETPLVFCRDKTRALGVAVEEFTPSHAVLDDAFQSWGVPRDMDVVLVDVAQRPGDGWLLPAGRLRESAGALSRADYVGVNGAKTGEQVEKAGAAIRSLAGESKPVFGIRRGIEIVPAVGNGVTGGGAKYAAVSAIARPGAFERQLGDLGLDLVVSFRYPDHHKYSADDAGWIIKSAAQRGAELLVTTEKDWVKLDGVVSRPERFALARLSLELFGDTPPLKKKRAAE